MMIMRCNYMRQYVLILLLGIIPKFTAASAITLDDNFLKNGWIRAIQKTTKLPNVLLPIIVAYVGYGMAQMRKCKNNPGAISFSPDGKQVVIAGLKSTV